MDSKGEEERSNEEKVILPELNVAKTDDVPHTSHKKQSVSEDDEEEIRIPGLLDDSRFRGRGSGAQRRAGLNAAMHPVSISIASTRDYSLSANFRNSFRGNKIKVKETTWVTLSLLCIMYYVISIPFKLGFYFDPLNALTVVPVRPLESYGSLQTYSEVVIDIIGVVIAVRTYFHRQKVMIPKNKINPNTQEEKSEEKENHDHHSRLSQASSTAKSRSSSTFRYFGSHMGMPSIIRYYRKKKVKDEMSRKKKDLAFANWCELIAILPLEVLVVVVFHCPELVYVVRITKLLRLHRLRTIIKELEARVYRRLKGGAAVSLSMYRFVSMLVLMISVCHFCACGFMLLAHFECGLGLKQCTSDRTCWALEDQLQGTSVTRQYIRSMYWCIVTLITVGYGDIVPVTSIETVYVGFVEILGALMSTAVIATFAFIFSTSNLRYVAFTTHVDTVQIFMESRQLPEEMRKKVLSYFYFIWSTQKGIEENDVLQVLPEHFRIRCVHVLRSSFLSQIPFLANEAAGFLSKLATAVESTYFSPGDYIIENYEDVSEMYFIYHGEVTLTQYRKSRKEYVKVGTLHAGKFFAELALFQSKAFSCKAMAEADCEILSLSRASFNSAIKSYYQSQGEERWTYMVSIAKKAPDLGRKASMGGKHFREMYKKTNSWKVPSSNFRTKWRNVGLIGNLLFAFLVPYHLSFGFHPVLFTILCIVDVFFIVDTYLNSCKFGYENYVLEGLSTLVTDPFLIFQYYKLNGFYLDLLSALPLELVLRIIESILDISDNRLAMAINAAAALRLIRLRRLLDGIRYYLTLSGVKSTLQDVTIAFMSVILLLHWSACVWLSFTSGNPHKGDGYIPTHHECLVRAINDGTCTWSTYDGLDSSLDTTSFMHYVRSIYWAVVCVTTVGYGDIRPFTTNETLFAMICVYVGGFLNYGVVGAVSAAVTQLMAKREEYYSRLSYINRFMEMNSITPSVRECIRKYFLYQWSRKKGVDEAQLLETLPYQLKEHISEFLNKDSIREIPIFKKCSDALIKSICTRMRQQVFQKEDYIIRAGDIADSLCIINRGRVEVRLPNQVQPVSALEEGAYFGEVAFLTNAFHSVHVLACSFCDITMLKKADFDEVIMSHSDELILIRIEADALSKRYRGNQIAVSNNLKKKKIKRFAEEITTFYPDVKNPPGIVSPHTTKHYMWMVIIFLICSYNMIQISFRIAFMQNASIEFIRKLSVLDYVFDVILAIDVYLQYYTFGYLQDGEDELDPIKIRQHYKQNFMKTDLLALLPIYYFGDNVPIANFVRLNRLIKCSQLPNMLFTLERFIQDKYASAKVSSMISLLNLLTVLLVSAHFAGCLFYLIGAYEDPENWWQNSDSVLNTSVDGESTYFAKYVRSFYWGLGTLTLVVYGDIVPRGMFETIFTFLICLAALFIIGQVIGRFTSLILRIDQDAFNFKQKKDNFDSFASIHDLPTKLVFKTHTFLEYEYEKTRGLDSLVVMDQLPPSIRLLLSMELYKSLLTNQMLFTDIDSGRLTSIAERLRPRVYLPYDTILSFGTTGRHLYIMRQGRAIVQTSDGLAVASIQDSMMFGEIGFFLRIPCIADVIAASFCETMSIDLSGWQRIFAGTAGHEIHLKVKEKVKRQKERYEETHASISRNWNRTFGYDRKSASSSAFMNEGKSQLSHQEKLSKWVGTTRESSRAIAAGVSDFLTKKVKLPSRNKVMPHGEAVSTFESDRIDRKFGEKDDDTESGAASDRTSSVAGSFRSTNNPRSRKVSIVPELGNLNKRIGNQGFLEMEEITNSNSRRTSSDLSRRLSSWNHENQSAIDSIWVAKATCRKFAEPNSSFRKWWNGLMLGGMVYMMVAAPLRLGMFFPYLRTPADIDAMVSCTGNEKIDREDVLPIKSLYLWYSVDYLFDIAFISDIILRLVYFTRFSNGEIVTDRAWLRDRYLKSDFWYHVLAVFPTELLLIGFYTLKSKQILCYFSMTQLLACVRLNRLLRLTELPRRITKLEEALSHVRSIDFNVNTLRFVRTIGIFLLANHWIACGWYLLGRSTSSGEKSWISVADLTDSTGLTQYIQSYYFSLTSTTTVGYGDIVSTNVRETLGQIIVIIASVSLFGSLVAAHELRIERVDGHKARYEEQVNKVSNFLTFRDIPLMMRGQIIDYYDSFWNTYKGVDEAQALSCLPLSLQQDISLYIKRKIIDHMTLFDNCEMDFVRALVVALKREVFLPDVVIVAAGDISRSMYFIKSGSVAVSNDEGKHCVTLGEGQHFGEVSLLYDMPRSANCIAETQCEIYVLSYSAYAELLVEFPEYRERNRQDWVLSNIDMFHRESKLRKRIEEASAPKTHSFKKAAESVIRQTAVEKLLEQFRQQKRRSSSDASDNTDSH